MTNTKNKPGLRGEPHKLEHFDGNTLARFWRRVNILSKDQCWPAHGTVMNSGYIGFCYYRTTDRKKRYITVHRFSALLKYGDVVNNFTVMHTCDNRVCVNPDHLRIGTQKENIQDMHRKGRAVNTPSPGERNGYSKLTDDQVLWVRQNHRVIPQRIMAEQLGVHQSTIERITSGRGWQHLIT